MEKPIHTKVLQFVQLLMFLNNYASRSQHNFISKGKKPNSMENFVLQENERINITKHQNKEQLLPLHGKFCIRIKLEYKHFG